MQLVATQFQYFNCLERQMHLSSLKLGARRRKEISNIKQRCQRFERYLINKIKKKTCTAIFIISFLLKAVKESTELR